jgi:CRISPR/Cas system-associated exonuclease Cas4 (RecB family)
MKNIEAKMEELLNNTKKIESLLHLEKKRRGISKNSLLFVGIANIARYYWCAIQAVLKSRANELQLFSAYLYDRLNYSYRLGLINKLPNHKKDLLDIGNQITLNDIEKLFKKKVKRTNGGSMTLNATKFTNKDGKRKMIINPDLSFGRRALYETKAKAKRILIADPEEFPQLRGEILQTTKAEQYPSIRWNFEKGKYVVVGVPDGITDRFVYEFKTARNKFLMSFTKPVALTQANLYGYFFKRNKKRVQIHIVEEKTTETWQTNVDKNKALTVLKNFGRVDAGWIPPLPKKWKCKSCEYKQACPAR